MSIGWNIDLKGSTNTSYGSPIDGCPWIDTNYTWTNASTTQYYSFQYQWCDVEAVVTLGGSAHIVDLTTGHVIHSSNIWAGYWWASGRQIINYRYVGSYSNRSYWSKNYSYYSSDNYTFTNSTARSATLFPTWYMNGSFKSADRYAVDVELNGTLAAESFMFFGGRAEAQLQASKGAHHEDLSMLKLY